MFTPLHPLSPHLYPTFPPTAQLEWARDIICNSKLYRCLSSQRGGKNLKSPKIILSKQKLCRFGVEMHRTFYFHSAAIYFSYLFWSGTKLPLCYFTSGWAGLVKELSFVSYRKPLASEIFITSKNWIHLETFWEKWSRHITLDVQAGKY